MLVYRAADIATSATRKEGSVAASTVTYGYDLGHQIISEASNEAAPLLSATYAYDGMGNPTTFTDHSITANYSVNSANQITATSATGNISSTLTYNGGNLTQNQGSGNGAGTATYTYDGANRLTQIVNTNASGTNLTKSVFTYDGLSRKRQDFEYTWTNGAWALSSELRFIYAGMNLLQTRNGSNVVQAQYTWGAGMGGGIGGLLARTVGTPAHHYYYHYDGGGNVTTLTNASQQVVARYQYGAYGNIVSSGLVSGDAALTDSTDLAQQNANPFRFSTKWLHSQSGLYDYGFRFYNPGLARFINRDPIRERGGVNLYVYAANNPINYGDFYGLIQQPIGISMVDGGPVYYGSGSWSPGMPLDSPTNRGNPSWSTVRRRYWKNEATNNPGDWSEENLERMRTGRAPQRLNPMTGEPESMELHHDPPQRSGGLCEVERVWPDEHAAIDPYRNISRPVEPPQAFEGGGLPETGFGEGGGGAAAGLDGEGRILFGGGGCFAPGTLVLMADGKLKAIETIRVGDLVLARDERTGKTEARRVFSTPVRMVHGSLTLRLSNGESIETTGEHPFYVPNKGFMLAGRLEVGVICSTQVGTSKIVEIMGNRDKVHLVYNLGVTEYHTYFVGKSKIWVHNGPVEKTDW